MVVEIAFELLQWATGHFLVEIVCVYVCVCAVYASVCMCVCLHASVCIRACIYVLRVCMCVCAYVCRVHLNELPFVLLALWLLFFLYSVVIL